MRICNKFPLKDEERGKNQVHQGDATPTAAAYQFRITAVSVWKRRQAGVSLSAVWTFELLQDS